MHFIVNGERIELHAATLADLLASLDYRGDWLATAVNGQLVARTERAGRTLSEGDRIEILSPKQGG